jgi:hypothetical protein
MNQHNKPCSSCPFATDVEPTENPGGSPLDVYVAQILLGFRVPCHQCIDYDDPDWHSNTFDLPECAGLAAVRSSLLGNGVPEHLMRAEQSERTFRDIFAWYAHHKGVSIREAVDYLTNLDNLREMTDKEMRRAGMQIRLVPKDDHAD